MAARFSQPGELLFEQISPWASRSTVIFYFVKPVRSISLGARSVERYGAREGR